MFVWTVITLNILTHLVMVNEYLPLLNVPNNIFCEFIQFLVQVTALTNLLILKHNPKPAQKTALTEYFGIFHSHMFKKIIVK